jgi:uncharacterized membrane-anchored protein
LSRRVYVTGITANPVGEWVTARNLSFILGLEAQGGHDPVDVLGGAAHDSMLDRPGADVVWAVAVEQTGEVRDRDTRHHGVDALFDSSQERDRVGAERHTRSGLRACG